MSSGTYSKEELDKKFKASDEKNDAWSATIMKTIENSHQEQIDRYDVLEGKIDPVLEILNGSRFVRAFFVTVSGILISLAALIAATVYILNWLRHG